MNEQTNYREILKNTVAYEMEIEKSGCRYALTSYLAFVLYVRPGTQRPSIPFVALCDGLLDFAARYAKASIESIFCLAVK